MTTDFVSGQGNASLQDVMVNLQKASLASSRWCRCATNWSPPTTTS